MKAGLVRHESDTSFVPRLVLDVVETEHTDRAGIAAHQVQDQLDQRGFAGSVRSDQPHDETSGQAEGHIRKRESLV